jgi:hypothetical protein
MTETSTVMKYLVGCGAIIAVGTPMFIGGQYVSDLRHEMDASKNEVSALKGQILQLQDILQKSQAAAASGVQGQKGDKGDRGDRGEKGETGERGPQGETGPVGPAGVDAARLEALENLIASVQGSLWASVADNAAAQPMAPPSPMPSATVSSSDLRGTWVGNVACSATGFTTTLTLTEQVGSTASGLWKWSGSNSGQAKATLGPSPTKDDPSRYILVTDGSAYDYHVNLQANLISGVAVRNRCDLRLER